MAEVGLADIGIFVKVVQCQSFGAAARALGIARSSVSRRVARLEDELGVRLLQRDTRSLTLTAAGVSYYREVSQGLAVVQKATQKVAAQRAPQGLIKLTAPPGFAAEVLPRLIARFANKHPEVQFEVDVATQMPNLVSSGFDLAICGGLPEDSSMVIRKLRDTVFKLYASPKYLDQAGRPSAASELGQHSCLIFVADSSPEQWTLVDEAGQNYQIKVRGYLRGHDLTFLRNAAIEGSGIALLPEVPGSLAVQQGVLEPVLPQLQMKSSSLYLVYTSNVHQPAAVRAFCDFMRQYFPSLEELQE